MTGVGAALTLLQPGTGAARTGFWTSSSLPKQMDDLPPNDDDNDDGDDDDNDDDGDNGGSIDDGSNIDGTSNDDGSRTSS